MFCISVCKGMAISFDDGDQLSFIAVNDPNFHGMFMTMCPTYTFIDRANGKFNSNMTFKREYSALISAAWEIDKVYDQYLSNPESETNPETVLGISPEYKQEAIENFIISYRNILKNQSPLEKVDPMITKLAKMFGLQNMDSVTLDFIADLLLDMRDDKKKKKSKKEEG